MFCLFRKKEAKKENELQKIHQRLCQNECILINNMLYWKNNDRLTGTVVDEIGNQIRIDMDVLDNWLYPDSYKQQALTEDEFESFEKHASNYMKVFGYEVEVVHPALSGICGNEK